MIMSDTREMKSDRDEFVILSRCSHTKKLFGIVVKKCGDSDWCLSNVFHPLGDSSDYDDVTEDYIKGNFYTTSHYPGCPSCGSVQIVKCGNCQHVACYNGKENSIQCPWCKKTLQIDGTIEELKMTSDL